MSLAFRQIWRSPNEGKDGFTVYEMTCPEGFKPMGDIVVQGFERLPDLDHYMQVQITLFFSLSINVKDTALTA